jgi:hypothetical protein
VWIIRGVPSLAGWNRLTLLAWLVVPLAGLFTYLALWAGIPVHGPAQFSFWPYLFGLLVLVACGVAGVLALFGVGGRDERPLGCLANCLLIPIGGFALWALIHHLSEYGLPD